MTRAKVLHKLVALGPLSHDEARHYTGWTSDEVHAAAYDAREAGLIVRRPAGNQNGIKYESKQTPEGWSNNQ